ncbi:acetyltransferase [Rasiella sp. SM2506]|uniref:acetyltransferase n=1 Tax=Rasiella sp. SM2506 TaxID=3423914 RepID=UPI003D7AEEF2
MKGITIFGGGGHCYALVALILANEEYKPIVILDKNPSEKEVLGVPVEKRNDDAHITNAAAIAIGNNTIRKKIAESLTVKCPTFIHTTAVVYPSAIIGKGVQLLPNAVVDAAVTIGDFTIVNNNATVSHNTIVGNYCHIAINAAISGGCIVGEGTLVGAGSIILPEITIGKWVTIGAGAVVTKNIPDGAIVVGNPAKIINT